MGILIIFSLNVRFFQHNPPRLLEKIKNISSEKEIDTQNSKVVISTCLYGHPKLSKNANKNKKATIKVILEGNRFSQ